MPNDEEDEWTVVLASDKKRVMRKTGLRRKRPSALQSPSARQTEASSTINADAEMLYSFLRDCMDYLSTSDVWLDLIHHFDTSLDSLSVDVVQNSLHCRKRQVVAFGIGNFANSGKAYYSAPLFQLAIVECLRQHWMKSVNDCDDSVSVVFYDPRSTQEEISFLKEQLKYDVLTSNEKGNHPVGKATTLFFMPHCPAQLYEHVVWSNYDSAQRIIYVGNSFSHLAQRVGRAKVYPCIQSLLPWLQEAKIRLLKADWKEAPGNLYGAMNDTFISYYKNEEGNPWPSRPYESWTKESIDDPELL